MFQDFFYGIIKERKFLWRLAVNDFKARYADYIVY